MIPFTDLPEPDDSDPHVADQISDRRYAQRREGWRRWRMMQVAFFLLVIANVGAFYFTWTVDQESEQNRKEQTAALVEEARHRAADLEREADRRAYDSCRRGNEFRKLTADAILGAVKAALGPPIVATDPERQAAREAVIARVEESTAKITAGGRDCVNDLDSGG